MQLCEDVGLFCCKGTLLALAQLVHQDLKVLLCKTAFQQLLAHAVQAVIIYKLQKPPGLSFFSTIPPADVVVQVPCEPKGL